MLSTKAPFDVPVEKTFSRIFEFLNRKMHHLTIWAIGFQLRKNILLYSSEYFEKLGSERAKYSTVIAEHIWICYKIYCSLIVEDKSWTEGSGGPPYIEWVCSARESGSNVAIGSRRSPVELLFSEGRSTSGELVLVPWEARWRLRSIGRTRVEYVLFQFNIFEVFSVLVKIDSGDLQKDEYWIISYIQLTRNTLQQRVKK